MITVESVASYGHIDYSETTTYELVSSLIEAAKIQLSNAVDYKIDFGNCNEQVVLYVKEWVSAVFDGTMADPGPKYMLQMLLIQIQYAGDKDASAVNRKSNISRG